MDERVDVAVQGVVRPHHRRPAASRLGQRVHEQARRMVLLGEERAVEHRRLQHRDLQAREQRLDAVRQILGLEDEVEQHRDQLDRHRFELVRLLAERRLLQVAQDVVLALRDAGELDDRAAAEIEVRLAGLQAREALAQHRRRHDRRARDVARRRRRHRSPGDVARGGGVHRNRRERLAAVGGRSAGHPHSGGITLPPPDIARHRPRSTATPAPPRRTASRRPVRVAGVATEPAAEKLHHVDFRRVTPRHRRWRQRDPFLARAIGRLGAAAAAARAPDRQRPAHARRHDVEVLQVLVEIGVDAVDLRQRRPIELLQDRELGVRLRLDRLQRFRERLDDRRGREGIAVGLEIGLSEQVADAAVQELQLVVAQVFDHADDVARDHGLVHRVRVDERELVGLELREFGLRHDLARDAVVDVHAQAPLELREEARLALLQRVTGVEASHLLLAHVGAARPIHQHLADAIEHRAEGGLQTMNGDIPAIAENPRHVARNRLPGRRFGRGRVQGRCAMVNMPLV